MRDLLMVAVGWLLCDLAALGLGGFKVTTAYQFARLAPLAWLGIIAREWWSGKSTPPATLIDARQGADSCDGDGDEALEVRV